MPPDAICGKCGTTLPEDGSDCDVCSPPRNAVAPAVPAAFAILLMLSSLLMLGTSFVNVVSAPVKVSRPKTPENMEQAAYAAAKQFLVERVHGSRNLSEFSQSMLERKGDQYNVMIAGDEIVNGQPVHKFYLVAVRFEAGSWHLDEIKQ